MTTKVHLVADSQYRPIDRVTTAGQRHDSVAFRGDCRRFGHPQLWREAQDQA